MSDLNFEQQLKKLEEIVSKMEQGDLSLEDSMKSFEDGLQIVNSCQSKLEKVEQRVSVLKEGKEDILIKVN